MHITQEEHWEATLRMVRYLKDTAGHGVLFRKNEHLDNHGYADADWAGWTDDPNEDISPLLVET